jgi:hypothetical protein
MTVEIIDMDAEVKNVQPKIAMAPAIEGLQGSAIVDTGRFLEWNYFHPDDCTAGAKHFKVKFFKEGYPGALLTCKDDRPYYDFNMSFERGTDVAHIVDRISSSKDYLPQRAAYEVPLDERMAAAKLMAAGLHHPSLFKDAWTCPTVVPGVFYYIRKPLEQSEVDDLQFLPTESNGPVSINGAVEVGIIQWSGSHRIFSVAKDLDEAISVVKNGELRPQSDVEGMNPFRPRMMPMSSIRAIRADPSILRRGLRR